MHGSNRTKTRFVAWLDSRLPGRRLLELAAGLLAAAWLIVVSSQQAGAQNVAPAPGSVSYPAAPAAAPAVPKIIGQWSGPTKKDGNLTVQIGADGRLGYWFSGGAQEHGFGTFQLRGGGEILFAPQGSRDPNPEVWDYSFDLFDRLKLEMDEDVPAKEEQYILTRTR